MTALSNISIITLIIIHIILILGAIAILFLDGFKFSQSFNFHNIHSYFQGPNPSFKSVLAIMSFMIYVIFGYGGMESVSGLVDKLKNPKKNLVIGVIVGAFLIVILYIIIIITIGSFANWKGTFGTSNINLGNLQIYLTQEEFFKLGHLLDFSNHNSLILGQTVNRLITALTLIGLTSVPIRIYTPIKHMFEGMPEELLPKKLTKINKNGVPSMAILFQTLIVVFFILLLGFNGSSLSSLFSKITLMTSVAAGIPVSFIIFAYIKFKLNNNITKEREILSKKLGICLAIVTFITISFVNLFSIIVPSLTGNITNSLWILAGPLFFIILALILILRKNIATKKTNKS